MAQLVEGRPQIAADDGLPAVEPLRYDPGPHQLQRVSELGEEVARLGLEGAAVLLAHLVAPGLQLLLLGRRRGEGVLGLAVLGRPLALALLGRQRAVQLAQPLGRALVVVEHRRLEIQLDEPTDAPQRRLRVRDQVLVAQLDIVLHVRRLPARGLDPAPPLARPRLHRLLGRAGALAPAPARERHVAPVADEVDEPRLRQGPPDAPDRAQVVGGLVAPAALALRLRVELVEGSDRRLRTGLPSPPGHPLRQLGLGEVKVGPAPPGRDLGRQLGTGGLAVVGAADLPRALDHLWDEVGLGRDREVRVGVEHHPQQGRPRAGVGDDERGRVAHPPTG